jgi:epsilon-lactone hydrolase
MSSTSPGGALGRDVDRITRGVARQCVTADASLDLRSLLKRKARMEEFATTPGAIALPARSIPLPVNVSAEARAALCTPRPSLGLLPDISDKDAWRQLIARSNAAGLARQREASMQLEVDVAARELGGVPCCVATPRRAGLLGERHVVFEIHGGALIFMGGGENVRAYAARTSLRSGRVTYAIDYRVAPDHPYPAALDDCLAAYRALVSEVGAERIVVAGVSAGANLAAALLLRGRDEGMPTPAATLLLTPELDLTESGDSFHTMRDLDVVLVRGLMPINLLYADGADLEDPYLSPLFGDVAGFPPTLLQAGTRDLFLSNAVLMHRKLRRAGVRAELHIFEGMPHGGFSGVTPEDLEIHAEVQAFLASL